MKSPEYALGIAAGFAAVIIVTVIISLIIKKLTGKKAEYDERQIAIRGKAYKVGCITYAILLAASMLVHSNFELTVIPFYLEQTAIMLAGLGAFVCFAIWNDAYFCGNEKRKNWAVLILLASAANFAVFFKTRENWFTPDGIMNSSWSNLFVSILTLIIAVNALLKIVADKKAEKTEKDD
ncbi:MAG: hypothetical protein J6P07_07220 [Spirochaetaceae bacterium]|nr:hypothetical protein [Spirochaetaceae bacterium]